MIIECRTNSLGISATEFKEAEPGKKGDRFEFL
jgi:hypothetical protein